MLESGLVEGKIPSCEAVREGGLRLVGGSGSLASSAMIRVVLCKEGLRGCGSEVVFLSAG